MTSRMGVLGLVFVMLAGCGTPDPDRRLGSSQGQARQDQIALQSGDFIGNRFYQYNFFAGLTVRDQAGQPVNGFTMDQVRITEEILDKATGSVQATAEIDLPAQMADEWTEAGLFERAITDQKLDIVLIGDTTGSMGDFMDAAKLEFARLASLLQDRQVDWRIAGAQARETPDGLFQFRFYGPTEMDRLLYEIDYWFRTGGEWWVPSTVYDAILYSPWYGFREDARKIIVVVSDIVPASAYGTAWYPISCTNATSSAVELFAEQQGIEIYYSQRIFDHTGLSEYCDSQINPRACDQGNNGWGIGGSGLMDLKWGAGEQAVELDWPFDADDLVSGFGLSDQSVEDSLLYLVWESTFVYDEPVDLAGVEDQYEIRVTIEVADPDVPGEILETSFIVPIEKTLHELSVTMLDEEGQGTGGLLYMDMHHESHGRLVEVHYGNGGGEDDTAVLDRVVPGHYVLELFDSGRHAYQIHKLRADGWVPFDMPAEDFSLTVQANTSEHLSDRYKLLGILRDLDDWRLSGDPFHKFAEAAREWLYQIEADGLSWKEMVAIKRLTVALSGYANLTEYAKLEADRAIVDFQHMIEDLREIIAQVQNLAKSTRLTWQQQLAGEMLKIIYGIISQGRIPALLEMVNTGLDLLIEYGGGELINEAMEQVLEAFPPLGDIAQLGFAFVQVLAEAKFSDGQADWGPVIEAAKNLAISTALYTTQELVDEYVVEDIFDALELDGDLEHALHSLVREVLRGVTTRNGFDNFDQRLEKWAHDVGVYLYTHHRDDILDTVNSLFDRLDQALADEGVPEAVRDFMVGFARDLSLQAVPTMRKDGTLNFKINGAGVVRILVKHGLYNVVLKRYFVDEIRGGLWECLYAAQAYAAFGPPVGEDRDDWHSEMNSDFFDLRQAVGDQQEDAWNALSLQENLNTWAQNMRQLSGHLEHISKGLDVIAYVYPPLEPAAEALHGFALALGAITLVADATQFGLKLQNLEKLGNQAETLYQSAF